MGETFSSVQPPEKKPAERLDSWKEIAAHLNRDVRTVQRWERREGMPVHRHVHEKLGSVYALTSELDLWQQGRAPGLPEEEKKPLADSTVTPPTPKGQNQGQTALLRMPRWVGVAGLAGLIILAIAYITLRDHAQNATHPRIKSLAVLPLKNLSGDPTQEYLADGMTEAIIGRLAAIHDLQVTSHTSVMRFKNPQLSVPEIAKTLGVDAIVEGSVTREGGRIRVTAQLIRGATDEHFWSESYDREMRDALTLQSVLAESIAEKVEVTLSGEEHQRLAAARPIAPEVYESYLKGRFAYNEANSRAGYEQGISFFEEAITKDPTFAPAYLGLAETYAVLGTVFVGAPPEETRPKVMSAARKALELDPNLVEAHVALANVLQEEWYWADAEAEYRRALELSPNNADAHAAFAEWLLCQGRAEEALTWVQRGRELDPVAVSGNSVASILFQSHRYADATREARSVLAVRPQDVGALLNLGFSLSASNQPADAIPALEKALSISNGSPAVEGVLIRAYAHAGRRNDALRILADLEKRNQTSYIPAGAFVNAYLGLGENEEAFRWLERASKERSNILQFIKVHPFFDPLRQDPRFVELVRRVGLN